MTSGLRILFLVHVFVMMAAIISFTRIDHTYRDSASLGQNKKKTPTAASFSEQVASLLRHIDALFFFCVVMCLGLMTGMIQTYLLVFLGPAEEGGIFRSCDALSISFPTFFQDSDAHTTRPLMLTAPALQGAVLAANCAAEVPLMAASGWIIERKWGKFWN